MNQQNKKPIKIKAQLTISRTTSKLTPPPPRNLQPRLKATTSTTRTSQPALRQQSTSSSSCCSSSSISESTPTSFRHHHLPSNSDHFRTQPLNPTPSPRLDIIPSQPKPLTPSSLTTTIPSHPSPLLLPPPPPPSPSPPPPDLYDSARVNRKILDLEISNASLLAINGALERTKVKQQSEIRSLRGQLGGRGEPSEESEGSGSSTTSASTLLNHPVGEHPSTKDLDEDHHRAELAPIEELVAQDPHFAGLIKTIDTLILSATRALHHSPSICPEPTPRHPIPPCAPSPLPNHLRTKVLNPVEIEEKMLRSSFDRHLLHRDKHDHP